MNEKSFRVQRPPQPPAPKGLIRVVKGEEAIRAERLRQERNAYMKEYRQGKRRRK